VLGVWAPRPQVAAGLWAGVACTACGHQAHADHNASLVIEARARRAGGTVTNSTRSHPGGKAHTEPHA
jgi:putative transposase